MSTQHTLLDDIRGFVGKYVTFSDPSCILPLSLWVMATHLWPDFDAFPYLVITSETKRSGKTRLSEVLSFMAANSKNVSGNTAATMFRIIRDQKPTIFIDEAESNSGEAADVMRAVLNVGYRKGQVIPRMGKGGVVEEWPAYCPKVFVLIGDVRDTLRDRSIVVKMQRGHAPERFLYDVAQAAGNAIRDTIAESILDYKTAILDYYMTSQGLEFLSDRDEEIWLPLFAVCHAVAPQLMDDLTRAAVDMSTDKTAAARKHSESELMEAEQKATDEEYSERLLHDLLTVMGSRASVFTTEAIDLLLALPTGPWRKFRGAPLGAVQMSGLLSRFAGVRPVLIRVGGHRKDAKVARGYRKDAVLAAIKRLEP